MIIVEEAKPNELSTVVDITLAAYSEYEKDSAPGFWELYCANIRHSILNDSSKTVLVAKEDEVIKGTVLLCPPNSGAIKTDLPEMRLLAIPPEFRNLGIAKLLIEACEQRAAASNGAMTLHTTDLMKTAKAMYERRGYIRFPEIDFEPVPGFFVRGYKKMLPAPSAASLVQRASN
jgi:GNAT superfamily N-acetyltransferase